MTTPTTPTQRLRDLAEAAATPASAERVVPKTFEGLGPDEYGPATPASALLREALDVSRLARALDNGLQLGQPWTSDASYDDFLMACATDVAHEYAALSATPPQPQPASVERDALVEAVERALLYVFQLSGKNYDKIKTALSGEAFIRALEQDGYALRAAEAKP